MLPGSASQSYETGLLSSRVARDLYTAHGWERRIRQKWRKQLPKQGAVYICPSISVRIQTIKFCLRGGISVPRSTCLASHAPRNIHFSFFKQRCVFAHDFSGRRTYTMQMYCTRPTKVDYFPKAACPEVADSSKVLKMSERL